MRVSSLGTQNGRLIDTEKMVLFQLDLFHVGIADPKAAVIAERHSVSSPDQDALAPHTGRFTEFPIPSNFH